MVMTFISRSMKLLIYPYKWLRYVSKFVDVIWYLMLMIFLWHFHWDWPYAVAFSSHIFRWVLEDSVSYIQQVHLVVAKLQLDLLLFVYMDAPWMCPHLGTASARIAATGANGRKSCHTHLSIPFNLGGIAYSSASREGKRHLVISGGCRWTKQPAPSSQLATPSSSLRGKECNFHFLKS